MLAYSLTRIILKERIDMGVFDFILLSTVSAVAFMVSEVSTIKKENQQLREELDELKKRV